MNKLSQSYLFSKRIFLAKPFVNYYFFVSLYGRVKKKAVLAI